MIWQATLKSLAVAASNVGKEHSIRVLANSQQEAVKEVRFHAAFEGCSEYAITKIEVIQQ